jgi:hypothetical protein
MVGIWKTFQEGGGMNFIILLLGAPGLLVGVTCIALAARRSSAARGFGALALAIVLLIASASIAGVVWGRITTDGAVSGASIDPALRERIRAKGYSEAMSCAKFGVAFALLPLVGGLVALSARRRRS